MTQTSNLPIQNKEHTPQHITQKTEPLRAHLLAALGASPVAAHGTSSASRLSDEERAEYLAMLNGELPAPIPEDKANSILDSLWQIMNAFVDLGFGVGPAPAAQVLQAVQPCGQIPQNLPRKCDNGTRDAVECSHQIKPKKSKPPADNAGVSGRES